MARVYIEYDDFHNSPILETYDSEEAALERIRRAEDVEPKEIWNQMFDPDSEDWAGEYYGSNRWTLITEEDARERSDYWDRVAEVIRFDKPAPLF